MKSIRFFTRVFVLALASAYFVSCSEEDASTPVTEQEEAEITENSSEAENVADEEIQHADEAIAESSSGGRLSATTCATVIRNAVNKTITLDFGAGCTGPYGTTRSGKIIVTYSGEFDDKLANRVITFENYQVNNRRISGSIELRDFNLDANGNPTCTRKLVNFSVSFRSGAAFTLSGSHTVTWTAGFADGDQSNNEFTVTGEYSGTTHLGRRISFRITEPIVVRSSCFAAGGFARVSGIREISIGARTRVVDYGDGECDDTITVTINGRIYIMTLS